MTFKFKTKNKSKNKGHHVHVNEMGHRTNMHTHQNHFNTYKDASMQITQHLPEWKGEREISTNVTGDFISKNNNLIAQADTNLAEISKS